MPWLVILLTAALLAFGIVYIVRTPLTNPPAWGDGRSIAELQGPAPAAAGATLPTLSVTPTISLGLIGLVTLLCSAAAVLAGRQLRQSAKPSQQHWFEVAGGVVLIGLAVKTAFDAANL